MGGLSSSTAKPKSSKPLDSKIRVRSQSVKEKEGHKKENKQDTVNFIFDFSGAIHY